MHSDDPDYWCVAEALTPEAHGGNSVCVSAFLAAELRRKVAGSSPKVIPCGVVCPPNHTTFCNDPFRVVFSGRLENRAKCIHQVVRTMIAAARLVPRIECDLIGDGPERAACESLVSSAGLSDRIRFLGRLAPEEVGPFLQRSQAILMMSAFEGLPVALLEAMASGGCCEAENQVRDRPERSSCNTGSPSTPKAEAGMRPRRRHDARSR